MPRPASLDERPYRLESRMRENRACGSEGGEAQTKALSLALSTFLCAARFLGRVVGSERRRELPKAPPMTTPGAGKSPA